MGIYHKGLSHNNDCRFWRAGFTSDRARVSFENLFLLSGLDKKVWDLHVFSQRVMGQMGFLYHETKTYWNGSADQNVAT